MKMESISENGVEEEKVGTNDRLVLFEVKMTQKMQNFAIDTALYAFKNYILEKDIANHIKKEFDNQLGQTWHCFVGSSFGSSFAHLKHHSIHFSINRKSIVLFKTGPEFTSSYFTKQKN